jgi:hypothetical protein
MSKPRKTILLRVVKGALVPADLPSARMLRERNYSIGDILSAELKKPRNPKFHRMVHALGQLLIDNVPEFEAYEDAHSVLKRLQLEANIACDSIAIKAPGLGMLEHRVPRSISFENMDQAAFEQVYSAFCKHIAKTYWPGLDPAQIEPMAELMKEAA